MEIYLLFIHLIADFFMQSREMGAKKSKELMWWWLHITIIFFAFAFGLWHWIGFERAFEFALWNAAIHGAIDAIIWNVYGWVVFKETKPEREFITETDKEYATRLEVHKKELKKTWKYWEDGMFYNFIGADQFLHGVTLLGLWWWL